MRAALALLSLAWIGSTAWAQPLAPSHPASVAQAQAPASAPAVEKKRKGRARRQQVGAKRAKPLENTADILSGCLALWEPATHMSKGEWSRACRRVAERLRSTAVR